MSPPCSPQRVTRGPRTPAERGGGWFLAARRAPAPQAFDSGRGAVVIPAPPASRRCRRGGRQADRPGRAARPGCRRWWCRRRANRWVGLGEDERRAVRGAGHAVGEGEPAGGLADRAVRANVSEDTGSELARREAEAGVSDLGHDPAVDHHVAPRMAGLPAQVRIAARAWPGPDTAAARHAPARPAAGQRAGSRPARPRERGGPPVRAPDATGRRSSSPPGRSSSGTVRRGRQPDRGRGRDRRSTSGSGDSGASTGAGPRGELAGITGCAG